MQESTEIKETKLTDALPQSKKSQFDRESRINSAVQSMLLASKTIDPTRLKETPDSESKTKAKAVRKLTLLEPLQPCPRLDLKLPSSVEDEDYFMSSSKAAAAAATTAAEVLTASEQVPRHEPESRALTKTTSQPQLRISPSKPLSIMSTTDKSIGKPSKDPLFSTWSYLMPRILA